jgi:hypothetical protein
MVNRVKKMERISHAISGMSKTLLGKNLSRAVSGGATSQVNALASPNPIPGYKKGGRVRKTGIALVHKGEFVLTASQAKALKKLLKK